MHITPGHRKVREEYLKSKPLFSCPKSDSYLVLITFNVAERHVATTVELRKQKVETLRLRTLLSR